MEEVSRLSARQHSSHLVKNTSYIKSIHSSEFNTSRQVYFSGVTEAVSVSLILETLLRCSLFPQRWKNGLRSSPDAADLRFFRGFSAQTFTRKPLKRCPEVWSNYKTPQQRPGRRPAVVSWYLRRGLLYWNCSFALCCWPPSFGGNWLGSSAKGIAKKNKERL